MAFGKLGAGGRGFGKGGSTALGKPGAPPAPPSGTTGQPIGLLLVLTKAS